MLKALGESVITNVRCHYSVKKKKKKKKQEYKCFVYCRVGTPEQLTQTDDKEKENKLLKITEKH